MSACIRCGHDSDERRDLITRITELESEVAALKTENGRLAERVALLVTQGRTNLALSADLTTAARDELLELVEQRDRVRDALAWCEAQGLDVLLHKDAKTVLLSDWGAARGKAVHDGTLEGRLRAFLEAVDTARKATT